jgi:hypothetical protein
MSGSKIDKVIKLIRDAETKGVLYKDDILTGFSGGKLIGLLQRIAKDSIENDDCYLEVGVFQGLTLLSVSKVLEGNIAYGIDNYSQHDPDGKNLSIVNSRIKQLNIENASLINLDFEDALENLQDYIENKKVALYFIDGPHDYRSQLMCLELIKPYMSDYGVIVIDDSNYRQVRQANRDFLKANPEYKLLFEAYTECHPHNMTKEEEKDARNGWWDGINVIIKDPLNELNIMYPPTTRDKTLYFNDQVVHSEKASLCAPYLVRAISALMSLDFARFIVNIGRGIMKIIKIDNEYKGEFKHVNTFSRSLTKSKYNSIK